MLPAPPSPNAEQSLWDTWFDAVGDRTLGQIILREKFDGLSGLFQWSALRFMQDDDAEMVAKLLMSRSLGPAAVTSIMARDKEEYAALMSNPCGVIDRTVLTALKKRREPLSESVRALVTPYLGAVIEQVLDPSWPHHKLNEREWKWRDTVGPMLFYGVFTGLEPGIRADLRRTLDEVELSPSESNQWRAQRLAVHACAHGLQSGDRAELANLARRSITAVGAQGTVAARDAAQLVENGRHWPETQPDTVAQVLDHNYYHPYRSEFVFAAVSSLVTDSQSRVAIMRALNRITAHERHVDIAYTKILAHVSPSPGEATNAFIAEIPKETMERAGFVSALFGNLSLLQQSGLDRATRARLLQVPQREDRLAVIRALGTAETEGHQRATPGERLVGEGQILMTEGVIPGELKESRPALAYPRNDGARPPHDPAAASHCKDIPLSKLLSRSPLGR